MVINGLTSRHNIHIDFTDKIIKETWCMCTDHSQWVPGLKILHKCIDAQTISRFHFIAFIILPGLIIIWLHNCCFWLICSNCVTITLIWYGINMCSCMCNCHGVTIYYNECYSKTIKYHILLFTCDGKFCRWNKVATSNLLESIHGLLKYVELYWDMLTWVKCL